MTKQEKIREGVAEKIFEGLKGNSYIIAPFEWKELTGVIRDLVLGITDKVLEYGDSQGVVIKVNEELPLVELLAKDLIEPIANFYIPDDESRGYAFNLWKRVKKQLAGYEATVPLIKD